MEMDERQKFEHEMIDRLARIETKIDDVKTIRDTSNQAYSMAQQNSKDISEMKGNNKWLWRTMGAALIMIGIDAVITIL